MKRISSRDNADYRGLLKLAQNASERRETGLTVLDGIHLIEGYLAAFGNDRLALFVRESALDNAEIQALTGTCGGRATVLSDRLFDAAAPVESPTGVLGVAPVATIRSGEPIGDGLLVLVDGVQDPGNLGSILRSAAAAGASAAQVSGGNTDPWSPKCLRGGMGAQFRLPIRSRVDLPGAVRGIRHRLLATDSGTGESVYTADLSGPVALAIGAEGLGVSPDLLALAHTRVRIPMEPGVESLNAAAAAAIVLFEWRRRRQ
jgi:RNA methyltransferase, TrmH family